MNATELYNSAGHPLGIFACGKCRKLTLGPGLVNTKESAEACCRPNKCRYCGKDIEGENVRHRLAHSQCESDEQWRKECARLDAAEEVTDYDGWLYSDHLQGNRDGYFTDMGELLDYLADEEEAERPEFVFCCRETFHRINLSGVLENLCEDGWKDMADQLDTAELEKAIDAFHEANKDVLRSYLPDHKRKVRVPPAAEQ